jgi:hypothetical protein
MSPHHGLDQFDRLQLLIFRVVLLVLFLGHAYKMLKEAFPFFPWPF